MGLIKLGGPRQRTDDDRKKMMGHEEIMGRWADVKRMMETVGWKILYGDITKELAIKNTLDDVDKLTLSERKRYVEGLSYVKMRIREYETTAKSAEENLAKLTRETKE